MLPARKYIKLAKKLLQSDQEYHFCELHVISDCSNHKDMLKEDGEIHIKCKWKKLVKFILVKGYFFPFSLLLKTSWS